MKATITYIKLKSPFKFFILSHRALKIIKQLKSTNCKQYRSKGFWTKHYTMTLWNNEEEMASFARSGAHLEAMKNSKEIASEIRTISIQAEELPDWNQAKKLLANARVLKF